MLIAIALFFGGIYAVLYYLDDYALHGQSIEVPDCLGKSYAELVDELDADKFQPIIADSIYLKEMKSGDVVEQIPKAGRKVKEGRKIYLTIAAFSPPKVSMPKLVDLSLRQATALLKTYGLELGTLKYRPDVCTNCVLGQELNGVDLDEGIKIPRGTAIDLTVGQGLSNELTGVPYLIGLNLKLAKNLLMSSFLNTGAIGYDPNTVLTAEDSANAKIYRQAPFYSEEPIIRMGSSVDIFLTLDTNRIVHSVNPADTLKE